MPTKRRLQNADRMRYKMRMKLRTFTMLFSLLIVLFVGGCGVWHGAKDVSPTDPSEEGPGLLTGKRGGVVIFQK